MAVANTEHPTGKPPEDRTRLENRFWGKIDWTQDKNDCWEWKEEHYVNPIGYGYFWIAGKGKVPAHRVALALDDGYTNPDNLPGDVVRHMCGGPKTCCNPHHLETGTQQDNMRDYVTREMDPDADREYSPEMIRDIRWLNSMSSMTQDDIADEYGMTQAMVSAIVRGEQYAWVESFCER